MSILKLEMVEGNADIVYHNTYPVIVLAAGTPDNLKEFGAAEKCLVISRGETISIKAKVIFLAIPDPLWV